MYPDANSDDTEESATPLSGLNRRPLLKALGVGAALTLGSGVASAAEPTTQSTSIDPVYGYATPDAGSIAGTFDPDHEVELHVHEGVPYEPGPPNDTEHGPFFHFAPTGLSVAPGAVVQFTAVTPDHSVTAYHNAQGFQHRVPPGVPPFSSPVLNAGGAWLYEFGQPGVYDLYCSSHHILGMVMRIVVGEPGEDFTVPAYEDTFEGSEGPPPILPPFSAAMLEGELVHFAEPHENKNPEWVWLTPREVLDAPALDPDTIWSEGTVPFDHVLSDIDRFASVD